MIDYKGTFGYQTVRLCYGVAALALASCSGPDLPEDVALEYENLPKQVDFNQHIKPILSDKCFICHGPDEAKVEAGLQLHLPDLAYAELNESPGKYAIKPGKPEKSELVHRILSEDKNLVMPEPSSHLSLNDREKALLVKWIGQGAEYKDHWAFIPPGPQEVPILKDASEVVNPIDNFIQQRLEVEGLAPQEEADKETLLRRVTFDLTGLPPTLEEIEAFVNDDSPDAYEKQVDRLLASSHFGEQMTLDWMDLARYADTHGYTVDRYRDVSPWRDWVIKAFNENMPYDQFLEWQLAGDMMPNASREQILATTFNRLHPQNLEGGIIDEEFRSAYVADRADVVGEGLMGVTMACAKCHDHKYDPVSQKDYYELYSFFNNVNESGQIPWDWSMPVPTLMLPTEEEEEFLVYVEKLVGEKASSLGQVKSETADTFKQWIAQESYKNILNKKFPKNLVARFDFDSRRLVNRLNPAQKGIMKQQFGDTFSTEYTEGYSGTGLKMDGDTWLDLDKIGIYKRYEPFSVGIRVRIPSDLENGVIFHKAYGTRLHSYRGYHLSLKKNKLELLMAHVWPDNAIVEHTLEEVPKDRWVQLTLTYDGSSKASGLKVYMDGRELKTEIEIDHLYKDIVFNQYEDIIYRNPIEPGLQIGARWRGKGIGGAVVDDILVFERELVPVEVWQLANQKGLQQLVSKKPEALGTEDKEQLEQYYLTNYSKDFGRALAELKEARKTQADSTEKVQEIMVMKELPEPRETFVLERGQYDVYGDQVFPGTPERVYPYPDSLPPNRLGFAKWLTAKGHPLTARVAVNRYWKNMFGTGIVKTVEDFGNQGELPSHPELLDWLALEFVDSGWDVKKLMKLMVMSHTYRQSSLAEKEAIDMDLENRLLTRGPTRRLTGEMLRNNALAASGLMNSTIGGVSVKPYQPEGLWKINGAEYEPDSGDKMYRKSMYTIWKRSVPHPTVATFDTPERSVCTVRRQETNTPLQALVLLNDPAYVEAARVLGKQMAAYDDPDKGIATAFKKLTGRTIEKEELDLLGQLRKVEHSNFEQNPEKAKGWLHTGQFRVDPDDDGPLVAANAVVASTIMNMDATITKR